MSVIFQSVTLLPSLQNWKSWDQEIQCISEMPVFKRLRPKDGEGRPVGLYSDTLSQMKKLTKITHWEKLQSLPSLLSIGRVLCLFPIRNSLLHATTTAPSHPHPFSPRSFILLGNMVYGLYHSMILPSAE